MAFEVLYEKARSSGRCVLGYRKKVSLIDVEMSRCRSAGLYVRFGLLTVRPGAQLLCWTDNFSRPRMTGGVLDAPYDLF